MKNLIIITAAFSASIICSCGSNPPSVSYERAVPSISAPYDGAVSSRSSYSDDTQFQNSEQNQDNVEVVERKIIKNGTLKFETTDVNETKTIVSQIVKEFGGYISDENESDYSGRVEHKITIRVPTDGFDLFLESISKSVDKFDTKNIERLDITEEYIDIESRVKTKKELQNRYKELLKRAFTVDEMITLEREIGKLQTEIESFEGKLNYFNDRIVFSTLAIIYYQYKKTDSSSSSFGFFSEFVDGIVSGWHDFLWFVIGVSNLWVFILLIALAVYLFRKWRKRKKMKEVASSS